MPYLGNQDPAGFNAAIKDRFSGDNSTTGFTLSRAVANVNDLQIFVDNVRQEPTVAYSVSGSTLTFTEAPPTGTNNVYVVHTSSVGATILPPQDLGSTDYIFGDDISLQSDASVLNFGTDSEIKITHVHNTGILLTDSGGTPTLQLHDSNESVSSDGSNLILTSGGTAFKLPTADGSSGQALTTNASGVLSFATVSPTGIDDQSSSNDDQITIKDDEVVINEDSDNLDFRVESDGSANMLFVDGGNNRIGINQGTPSDDVELTPSADGKGITLKTTDNIRPYLNFDANRSAAGNNVAQINFKWNGTDVARIIGVAGSDTTNKDDGHITFQTAAAGSTNEVMRIASDGDVTVSDGNLVIGTSGHGISFAATSDGGASTPVELLDDYEEGTWTPAFVGATNTPGLHNNVGRYTRIGRLVVLQFFQQTSGSPTPTFSSNSAAFQISGVPFSVDGHGYTGSQGSMNAQAFHYNTSNNTQSTTADFCSPNVNGSDQLEFQVTGSGATRGVMNNTGARAAPYVVEATISYFTDA